MLISSSFVDDDLIASDIHNVFFQRLGRRSLDILAVQIEVTIVARTPDLADIGSVLDDARQVGTGRGECLELVVGRPDQYRRLATETENLPAVRFHFLRL